MPSLRGNMLSGHWRALSRVVNQRTLFALSLVTLLCLIFPAFTESKTEFAEISGTVFYDASYDGSLDTGEIGVEQVVLQLYGNNGIVASQTTTASGQFSFTGLPSGNDYFLVISQMPQGYSETLLGSDHQGNSILVTSGNTSVTFGLYQPDLHHYENSEIITPCYVEGPHNGAIANEAAIVRLPTTADGHHFQGTSYTSDYEVSVSVPYGAVGTVYGMAWQGSSESYYASAYHKRYTDFGPQGADAIYQFQLDGTLEGVIELDLLINTPNSTGGDVHDFTPNGNGEVFDLGPQDVSLDAVGKRGFGDIEMSADDSTLYVVNLWDKRIYAISVVSGNPANASLLTSWAAPDATGDNSHRPFGLAFYEGKLWVGSVDEDDLEAYVHSLDVSNGNSTLELTIPLNYPRQSFYDDADNQGTPSDWNTWITSTAASYISPSQEIGLPQAMLTDIEFAENGDMIIGFRDRFGDQTGAAKRYRPSDSQLTWGIAQGDILKACFSNGQFNLENGTVGPCPANQGLPNSGPNGREFYYWDIYEFEGVTWNPNANNGAFHWETAQGALLQPPGEDFVITTAMDPFHDFSGGILKLDNNTGARVGVNGPTSYANLGGGYTIYEGGDFNNQLPPNIGLAAKANGLGDIELTFENSIEIASQLWIDDDKDGIQDPQESLIENVLIELFHGNTKIGEAQSSNGRISFGGPSNMNLNSGVSILPFSNYELRISLVEIQNTHSDLIDVTLLGVKATGLETINSDAHLDNNIATIPVVTNDWGIHFHHQNAGFVSCDSLSTVVAYEGCQGDGYSVSIGSQLFDEFNPSGQVTLVTSQGCDSTVIVDLNFGTPTASTQSYQGCEGDGYSIIVGGTVYDQANPTGTEVIPNTAGCDSTITVDLNFGTASTETISYNGCEGDGYSITIAGTVYDETNQTGTEVFQNSSGCDSTIIIDLNYSPITVSAESYTGCTGDGFSLLVGGQLFNESNPSGQVVLTSSSGCDSIVNVDLTFTSPTSSIETYTGFQGDGYTMTLNGVTYNESNPTGIEVIQNSAGCDSTVTVNFSFVPPIQEYECVILQSDDFESGYNTWLDGGSDCTWIGNSTYASSGVRSIRLRDNTNSSVLTSQLLDLSNTDTLKVYFHFYPRSMETNEDFWLQISTDGGATYNTVETWVVNQDFTNDNPQNEIVSIPGPFSANSRVRFRCDASANGDQIYIDDVTIESCEEAEISCPMVVLPTLTLCAETVENIIPTVTGDSGVYTNHEWQILSASTSSNFSLLNDDQPISQLDLSGASAGEVVLSYTVTDFTGCQMTDTMAIVVTSEPLCVILATSDTICTAGSATLFVDSLYQVLPPTGAVPQPNNGAGVTLTHQIIGLVDPASTKMIITLPTWDDHFDEVLLNGQMILPKVLETASYGPVGMDCQTPWVANVNGLPRSIIEIENGSVRYFSSRTPSATTMTEVFPTAWTTTPRNFVEGNNTFQFGIQNTAGPVSGSWFIEVATNNRYQYQWSTGDTTDAITVSPLVTTNYQLTVTSPAGCESICSKTVYVEDIDTSFVNYAGCQGDGYEVIVGGVIYDETNPVGTESLQNQAGCDSIVIVDLEFNPTYNQVRDYQGCSGDGYELEVNGVTYNESNPTGTETMQTVDGCDSVVVVNLVFDPSVSVEAGMLANPICSNSSVDLMTLGASISGGTTNGVWTSTGGGIFDNGNDFTTATTYTPSNVEITNGVIILTLTSEDPPGLCEPEADAVMILVNDLRCSQFPWVGN